jgi:hypothetical protein
MLENFEDSGCRSLAAECEFPGHFPGEDVGHREAP